MTGSEREQSDTAVPTMPTNAYHGMLAFRRAQKAPIEDRLCSSKSELLRTTCPSEKQAEPHMLGNLYRPHQSFDRSKAYVDKQEACAIKNSQDAYGCLSEPFHLKLEGQLYKHRSKIRPNKEFETIPRAECFITTIRPESPLNRWPAHIWSPGQELKGNPKNSRSSPDAIHIKSSLSDLHTIELQQHESPPVGPAHSSVPWNARDTEQASGVAICYIAHLRGLSGAGWHHNTILGSARVDVDLIFSNCVAADTLTTMYQWIAQIISSFEVLSVPEKLGLMVLYGRYLKVCHHEPDAAVLANQT